jgi:RimJ/RimL family protein N-acetyltransferase
MICLDGHPIGYIRALRDDSDNFRVSIAIDDHHQGLGLGSVALHCLIAILRMGYPGASVTADVDKNNVASLRAFGKAGFRQLGEYRDGSCAMIRLKRRLADE